MDLDTPASVLEALKASAGGRGSGGGCYLATRRCVGWRHVAGVGGSGCLEPRAMCPGAGGTRRRQPGRAGAGAAEPALAAAWHSRHMVWAAAGPAAARADLVSGLTHPHGTKHHLLSLQAAGDAVVKGAPQEFNGPVAVSFKARRCQTRSACPGSPLLPLMVSCGCLHRKSTSLASGHVSTCTDTSAGRLCLQEATNPCKMAISIYWELSHPGSDVGRGNRVSYSAALAGTLGAVACWRAGGRAATDCLQHAPLLASSLAPACAGAC